MGYGDFPFFDIIIFAGIAVFLVFRLRKVLGKRTGFEKKHTNDLEKQNNQKIFDTTNNTPELSDNFVELKKAYNALSNFDHINFLEGAKAAFEDIINAFNKGDKATLKKLLTKETLTTFSSAIDNKQNDPESQVFSLNIEKIEDVEINKETITIKIKFISEQFKNNDESTTIKKEDIWSFNKPIKSKNPNWLLSST